MMERTATEDLGTGEQDSEETVLENVPHQSSPSRQHNRLSTLTEQREAFIQDRFSTTLEDPITGKRIRS